MAGDGEAKIDLEVLVAEYLLRRDTGEDVLEELCAAHPSQARELRARIGALGDVHSVFEWLTGPAGDREQARSFGRFLVVRELGSGGMGRVFLADDPKLNRRVAVKAMTSPNLANTKGHARFEREVKTVAQLKHPLIVPIWEAGDADGTPYFVMEYVPGVTLAQLVRSLKATRLEPSELAARHWHQAVSVAASEECRDENYLALACGVVRDIADALHHAHCQGVTHRDVKPSNIMVRSDGRAMLFDFGLARSELEDSLTLTGAVLGTPHYMAPEQARGHHAEVDARTDVFSLGVVLYQLLTLELPFEGTNTQEVLHAIGATEPRSIRRRNPRVPRDLEAICLKAMEKERDRRYRGAGELRDDLERFLQGLPTRARPPGALRRGRVFLRRHRMLSIAAIAGVVTFLLGVAVARHFEIGPWATHDRWLCLSPARQRLFVIDPGESVQDGDVLGLEVPARAPSVYYAVSITGSLELKHALVTPLTPMFFDEIPPAGAHASGASWSVEAPKGDRRRVAFCWVSASRRKPAERSTERLWVFRTDAPKPWLEDWLQTLAELSENHEGVPFGTARLHLDQLTEKNRGQDLYTLSEAEIETVHEMVRSFTLEDEEVLPIKDVTLLRASFPVSEVNSR